LSPLTSPPPAEAPPTRTTTSTTTTGPRGRAGASGTAARSVARPAFAATADAADALARSLARPSRGLPAWEELASLERDPAVSPALAAAVHAIKTAPLGWQYRTARWIVDRFLQKPCYQKFAAASWGDIIDLMADQVARNHELVRSEMMEASSGSLQSRASARLFRPFNQMPCTRESALKRVEAARALCRPGDPILLLGDDDLVSVDLARAGFRDVTAIDIDPAVLSEIERVSRDGELEVKLARHDLSAPPPAALVRDYRLVFFDPEYTMDGVRMFLDAALAFSAERRGTHFFLSFHLMSLMRAGLFELEALLATRRVEIRAVHPGFNAYPVPARLKTLIHLVNRFVICSRALATDGYAFPYLMSDAMILRVG
jgi:hypothetical protein